MVPIIVEKYGGIPIEEQQVEIVERKGIGHPDTICDSIAEHISIALCKVYLENFGYVLHHNIDKALLAAGVSHPRLGGGIIEKPMKLVLGDRATYQLNNTSIPVEEIAVQTAKDWLHRSMRYIDPGKHIIFQNEIKPGSVALKDSISRDLIVANDTSVAVGYAPLSNTEIAVLKIENYLNSQTCKSIFPECGEDVKVMAYRIGSVLKITIAIAMVDRYFQSMDEYFVRKSMLLNHLYDTINTEKLNFDDIFIQINTQDSLERGEQSLYLTVIGTSAEGSDSGQVGRGNRINGLISLNRPSSAEAIAGKNPINHIGKIYSVLSTRMANRIYSSFPNIEEVYVRLVSQIGEAIDRPQVVSTQVLLKDGGNLESLRNDIGDIISAEISDIYNLTRILSTGEMKLFQ